MADCAGASRTGWPFFAGASLRPQEDNPCYALPARMMALPRLPVLDINTIPRVVSPFTNQSYCNNATIWGANRKTIWGAPTMVRV